MDKLHPHAAALDRIGSDVLKDHFEITRQTIWTWKRNGVSRSFLRSAILLGEVTGKDVSELRATLTDELQASTGA